MFQDHRCLYSKTTDSKLGNYKNDISPYIKNKMKGTLYKYDGSILELSYLNVVDTWMPCEKGIEYIR